VAEASFTDISEWQKNYHYSTGGTRSKYIAVHPENNTDYFFKGSKETPEGDIRYPTEFWSEIVSSKIGKFLGFPLLDYNIGYDENNKQKLGCLSKSMITEPSGKLTEGITYLTGANQNYNPEKDKKKYTFQFICTALEAFKLERYIKNIIEIIVFDSIISNSDRHQENWGIIRATRIIELKNKEKKEGDGFWKKTTKFLKSKEKVIHKIEINDVVYQISTKFEFAPIYDSGCCLGREHSDEKISKYLKDSQMINAYINNGKSEIHWEENNSKSKHFELVNFLLEKYPDDTKSYINRVKTIYNEDEIKSIIYNIDSSLPDYLIESKLSDDRKEFMFKLITLRIEKLLQLI